MSESGVAFGLDLAGYTSGKTGLARAARRTDGTIRVTVFRSHAFSKKLAGHDPGFSEVVHQERDLVRRCLAWLRFGTQTAHQHAQVVGHVTPQEEAALRICGGTVFV